MPTPSPNPPPAATRSAIPRRDSAIMKLRDDPSPRPRWRRVLTQSNSFKLTGMIGRRPTDGELYMAHFMGVGGAAKLITNAEDNPHASARADVSERGRGQPFDLLRPRGARAQRLRSLFGADRRAMPAPPIRRRRAPRWRRSATSSQAWRSPARRRRRPRSTMRPICRPSRMSAAVTPVTMASASTATSTSPPTDPMFRSLFQAGDRAQPVSPAVRALWGNSSSLTSVASATSVAPATSVAQRER